MKTKLCELKITVKHSDFVILNRAFGQVTDYGCFSKSGILPSQEVLQRPRKTP